MDSTLVNLLKDLTLQSVELIKTAAPEVWAMTYQRVFIEACAQLWGGLFFLSLGVVSIILSVTKREDWGDGIILTFIAAVFCFVAAFILIPVGLITLYSLDFETLSRIANIVH